MRSTTEALKRGTGAHVLPEENEEPLKQLDTMEDFDTECRKLHDAAHWRRRVRLSYFMILDNELSFPTIRGWGTGS